MSPDLWFAPAWQIAEWIRTQQVSVREVLECHLERWQRYNDQLRAAATMVPVESLLDQAEEADRRVRKGEALGPLHGVPVTVKDLLATAGLRTTGGFPRLADHVPDKDASVVARLRRAGAIVLGKTNVPPGGDYQTVSPLFGRANNPWRLDRTPGGSTGGGAAAVAAGLSALELGSDLGGSVRLPAHYCGVVGYKPTAHRLPMTGHIPPWPGQPRGLRHLSCLGFLARSVRDLKEALRVTAGPDGVESHVPPVAVRDVAPPDPRALRIAVAPDDPQAPIAPDVRKQMASAVARLVDAGARVEVAQPDGFDLWQSCILYGQLFGAELNSTLPPQAEHEERERMLSVRDADEPFLYGYAGGVGVTLREYTSLLHAREQFIRSLESFLEQWNAWLYPAAPTTAPRHMPKGSRIQVSDRRLPYMAQGWFSLPFSLTHHPVVTLPVGIGEQGLPVGVQLVGRLWGDEKLLATAETLENVLGTAADQLKTAGPPGLEERVKAS